MNNFTILAIEKIEKELKNFKGDNKARAVSSYVADTLKNFCNQEDEFAQAICQNDKTLSDCCSSIMSKCGNAISDIEVYKKAVGFYFPGAGINFSMTIDLCASVKSGSSAPSGGKIINLSLTDLFD